MGWRIYLEFPPYDRVTQPGCVRMCPRYQDASGIYVTAYSWESSQVMDAKMGDYRIIFVGTWDECYAYAELWKKDNNIISQD